MTQLKEGGSLAQKRRAPSKLTSILLLYVGRKRQIIKQRLRSEDSQHRFSNDRAKKNAPEAGKASR